MTLITVIDASYRKERGWDFPGYPEGVWTAGTVISHDASGGSAIAQVNLATAGVPEGQAFSIETLSYQTNDTGALDFLVRPTNFDITGGLTIARGYQLENQNQTEPLAVVEPEGLAPHWFLGQIVDRSIASAISIQIRNTTGKVSIFHIGGYMWTPRSILQAEGGYRRPPDGLYAR